MCMDIIFHQGGRPMNAPTEKITNNYKWLQFTKIQLSRVDYYTHFPHSFQQLFISKASPFHILNNVFHSVFNNSKM